MRPTGEWLNRPGGLAERLSRMRKTAKLTGEQMAAATGWQRTKVSKIENGRQMPTEADIRTWAEVTGQPDEAAELLGVLSEAQSVHRQYRHQQRRGHAGLQDDLDRLTRQAARIRNVAILSIPGLLQTPDYARCRMAEFARWYGFPEDGIEKALAARRRRQEVLYEPGHEFEFVITEGSVRFWLAPREVMAGQIDRLVSLIGAKNITLGIIPMETEIPLTPLHGFMILDKTVYAELHGGEDLPPGAELSQYETIFDGLMGEAVTGDEARWRLMAAAARLRE